MKKKKSLITKRLYFAIAVLTLLIAAGIMTTAFTVVPPGMPTHPDLYTSRIHEIIGGGVEFTGAQLHANNINGTTPNAGGSGVFGKNTATGAEGRLGYQSYGVYTPGALYAGSVQTGALSMSGDMSAKSYTASGANANGFGVYSYNYPIYGSNLQSRTYVYSPSGYYGGAFLGDGVNIGSAQVQCGNIQATGAISSSDTIDANKGFSKSGIQGVTGCIGSNPGRVCVTGGIVTCMGTC